MNTNETIEYEIPTEEELDVSVQAAERRGIRIGIEKMRDAIAEDFKSDIDRSFFDCDYIIFTAKEIADRLLAEQEKQG